MIFLKIITQIITGISGLFVLVLDYKWHDKRKAIYKKGRNVLILFTVISLITGVIITIDDDKTQTKTITDLKDSLSLAQQNLLYIRSNSDTLKNQIKPFLELATRQYPTLNVNDALDNLRLDLNYLGNQVSIGNENISKLSSELTIEKKTIRTFDIITYIEFSGKWKKNPYPTWIQSPSPNEYIRWVDKSKRAPDIVFCSSKINFGKLNDQTGVFENTLSVQPGEYPLGAYLDILTSYNLMNVWIPFIHPAKLEDPNIIFKKIRMNIYINGSKKGSLVLNEEYSIDMTSMLNDKVNRAYDYAGFVIEEDLVNIFKIHY